MYNSAPAKGAVMHGPTKRADRKPSAAAPVTLPPERVGPVDWRRFIRADGKRNSNRPNSELARMRNSAAKEPRSHGDCSVARSEEHTSELQSLMRISYAVFCLTKNNYPHPTTPRTTITQ